MQQVLFRLPFGIPVYGFGLMLFLAFVLCTWLAGRRAQKVGVPRELMLDLCLWMFIGGLTVSMLLSLVVTPVMYLLMQGGANNNLEQS